ncbi:hypothetical protein Dimus_024558, partial [Dionaea muscipula]
SGLSLHLLHPQSEAVAGSVIEEMEMTEQRRVMASRAGSDEHPGESDPGESDSGESELNPSRSSVWIKITEPEPVASRNGVGGLPSRSNPGQEQMQPKSERRRGTQSRAGEIPEQEP